MTGIMLDPTKIKKYVNQLEIPPVYLPEVNRDPITGRILSFNYIVSIREFTQQILPPGYPETKVWGYGGAVVDPVTRRPLGTLHNAPGATFEAIRGVPINVQWVNNLRCPHELPVDPTLHWADPNNLGMVEPDQVPPFPPGLAKAQKPVPIVPHLHGGENHSIFDGHPDAWFTAGEYKIGPEFVTSLYHYPNEQLPTTLWYHDHVLGITRLNVLMGLAGFYLLRDIRNPLDRPGYILPEKKYEIPLAIQDRSFFTDGSFDFPTVGVNPEVHPYWVPEFFGNTIMVNGKVWPNLDVKRCQYRFRVLNGSNARFYQLKFSNNMIFIQIGSDGGYLPRPVTLTSLILAPGERADILVDFSSIASGTKLVLMNEARAPFPNGEAPDPSTTGQVMQFTVERVHSIKPCKLPEELNHIPLLEPDSPKRTLTLVEVMGDNGPIEVLLDGQKWSAPVSELPKVGSTEIWELVNLTEDAHPIHLHLVQFQVKNRQAFDRDAYLARWEADNGAPPLDHPTVVVPVEPYLIGGEIPPDQNETGWKDTVRANPNEVTRIIVRFAPQDADPKEVVPGRNLYPFNPSSGPGYVWHCHILDHEDNEMMRPYYVVE